METSHQDANPTTSPSASSSPSTTPSSPTPAAEYLGFDHVHFWVGNALQAAAYFICRFGFEPFAFRGLETGSREVLTHVVRQNAIIFAFSSPLQPRPDHPIAKHTALHGDGVKDVAFRVTDCIAIFDAAVAAGAQPVAEPHVYDDPKHGRCVTATIHAPYGETLHTFVERHAFRGVFLPNFAPVLDRDPQLDLVEPIQLDYIDHVVSNQPDNMMEPVVQWYVDKLLFHRFWSIDDSQVHTQYSALRSVVVADPLERVKLPVNEPAKALRKSQIQEFIDFYGSPGVQHIALRTDDIVTSVQRLRYRGVAFITVPTTYYQDLRVRLRGSRIQVREDLGKLEALGVMVDFDNDGYLLQIFTKPIMDRPTVFMEVIQRRSHSGFGAGNFKSLFEALESEQALRGNL